MGSEGRGTAAGVGARVRASRVAEQGGIRESSEDEDDEDPGE